MLSPTNVETENRMDLKEKVCLVTGGTKGIGAATAIALAREGAHVALVARNDDALAQDVKGRVTALGRRAEGLVADCAKSAETTQCVATTAERLGGVDVLVHAAGALVPGGLFEVTPEAWYQGFEVHVHAVFHLCRAAIPLMKKR